MTQPSKRLATAADIKSIDAEKRTVRALVSTGDLVRDNAIVLPSAWERRIGFYQANPVLLWCHPWSGEAIDRAPWVVIGKAIQIDIEPDGLYCTFQYAYDENPQARLVFDLVAGGYLRAFSVGFQPVRSVKKYSSETDKASLPEYARAALENGDASEVFTEVELWEVSQVWIGSDRRALAQAVRDGRVDRELVTRAFDGHDPFDGRSTMETQETVAEEPVARMLVPFQDAAARLHNLAMMLEMVEYDEEAGLGETIEGALGVLAEVIDSLRAMMPAPAPLPEPTEVDADTEVALPVLRSADGSDVSANPSPECEAISRVGRPISQSRQKQIEESLSYHERGIAIIRGMLSEIQQDDEDMPQGYAADEEVLPEPPSLDIDAALIRALHIMIERNKSQQ